MKSKSSRRVFRILIISFMVSFILLVAFSLYALRQIRAVEQYSHSLDHTNAVISELYKIDIIIRDLDVKERGFALTRNPSFIKELEGHTKTILPATQALKTLVSDNKNQLELLARLRGALALRLDLLEDNIQYYDTTTSRTISPYFQQARGLKLEALKYLHKMQANEYKLLNQRHISKQNSEKLAEGFIQWLITIFFVLTFVLFLVLMREVYIRRNFQKALQQKVVALQKANDEMEQITYALSHNIQEPLRKIQVFSDKLLYSKNNNDASEVACRIDRSAKAMQGMIRDMEILLGLKKEDYEEIIPMAQVVKNVQNILQEKISKCHAIVQVDLLPQINGNYKQVELLFKSLIDNALNFSKEDVTPVIHIKYDGIVDGKTADGAANDELTYYKMTLGDNGIGFDNKYSEKIFQIFQRLDNDNNTAAGKGIGLSLCKRIMDNHNGMIKATGNEQEGAIFTLYFPSK